MSSQPIPIPESLPTQQTINTTPFKMLVTTFGGVPTDFKESMTYYELLAWLVNYFQTVVIPKIDENTEATNLAITTFNELKDWIEHYFDNLDVQEEINNKLDQMAEDGTLQEIIAAYVNTNAYLAFDTVSDMKNGENLINGSFVKTLGYRNKNDGGGNFYKIREITNDDVVDEMILIGITADPQNLLVAEIVADTSISPEQLGANCDLTNDDSTYLSTAFTFAKTHNIPLYLNKNYYINTNITLNAEGKHIDVVERSGELKIDESVKFKNFASSEIILNLKDGGSNDVNDNSVVFEDIHTCSCKLTAVNVNQTAFYVNHRNTDNSLSRNDFKVYGESNMRTLLHKPTSTQTGYIGGYFFGTYSTICDRVPQYPIRFEGSNDITINHYENYFADQSLTKNSLEIIECGSVHINKLAVGDCALNGVFIQSSDVTIDEALVINGKDNTHPTRLGVGIKLKFDCGFKCNALRTVHCSYALDCTELTNANRLLVNRIFIDDDDSNCKGIQFASSSTSGIYPLAYNMINNPIGGMVATSSYGNVENVKIFKQNNLIYVSGYMLVSSTIPSGSHIMDFSPGSGINGCVAYQRTEFPVSQGGSRAFAARVAANGSYVVSDVNIDPANGNILAFNFIYRAKEYITT